MEEGSKCALNSRMYHGIATDGATCLNLHYMIVFHLFLESAFMLVKLFDVFLLPHKKNSNCYTIESCKSTDQLFPQSIEGSDVCIKHNLTCKGNGTKDLVYQILVYSRRKEIVYFQNCLIYRN